MSSIHTLSIRIDKELVDNLKLVAQEEGRSLNKQIEYILKEYLKKNSL